MVQSMNDRNPPLLTGKLRLPHSIPGVIARNRLQNRLIQILDQVSVGLVIAPPGFGKTTIVSQTLHVWNHPTAWLQLDAEDNDPAQFWTYLTAALQTIHPEVPHYVSPLDLPSDSHAPLIRIANAIEEEIKEPFALVLDDFHHITSEAIYRQLEWFITRNIPMLRLVLISRVECPLNLARVQVRHQLETIDVEALRFTANETAAFLRDTMALAVNKAVVERLLQVSEGWPAALHLMALRLRHGTGTDALPGQFVRPDAHLTRYFDEEVFNPLPVEFQDFLLRTSLLRDIQLKLCQVVTGVDGRNVLEHLTRNQLFVIRLDNANQDYRYHSLFAEYLQDRIKQNHPDWVQDVHRKAAEYYQGHGLIEPAIEHALLSGNYGFAEHLMCDTAWNLITFGLRDTVASWFERIPAEHIKTDPRLSLCYAWVLYLQGKLDPAKQLLVNVDELLSSPADLSPSDVDLIQGESHTLWALVAHLQGDLNDAVQHAQQALQLLPVEQTFMRGCALGTLGYTQWMEGNALAAHQILDDNLFPTHYVPDELSRLLVRANQANMLIFLGHLHEAGLIFEQILTAAQSDLPRYQMIAAAAYCGIGFLEYAWNDLNSAANHTRTALKLGQPWIYMNALLPGYVTLSRIEQGRHRFKAAERALDELEHHINVGHLTQLQALLEVNRIRLQVAQGNSASVRKWALRFEQLDKSLENDTADIWPDIVYAEVMIAENHAEQIMELLKRLNARCGLLSLEWMRLDIQLLQCIAYWSLGQNELALNLLRDIVIRAEPENHIRLFLDRGSVIETMLRQLELPKEMSAYVSELLTAFEAENLQSKWIELDPAPNSQSADVLSLRERETLSLMAQGATNEEIAHKLVIAHGTVKTHVKHILRKLNAGNRTEAIARARARSLIE
ncbi:MAG: LuxR C-terminal-related transcriptional regulator [Chloroflexota bacterium]